MNVKNLELNIIWSAAELHKRTTLGPVFMYVDWLALLFCDRIW